MTVPAKTEAVSHRLGTKSPVERVLRVLVPSVATATVFVASGTAVVLVRGAAVLGQLGYDLVTLCLAYYAAAGVTGVVGGLMLPLARRGRVGASLVGAACGMLSIPIMLFPPSGSLEGWIGALPLWIGVGAVGGALVGYEISSRLSRDEMLS